MKVFRILGLTILGIVALLVAIVVVATLVIDPNTYKPQIEKAVERSTRLDLTLAGNIDWSLIPLGLTLNDVSADLDGELLTGLDTLVAQVDFWSLLRFEPEVNTFILEGMTVNLVRNAEGQGNWERIMREPEATAAAQTPAEPSAAEAPAADSTGQALQFEIEEIRITDAELRYSDQASGQELVLDQINLTAQNITLGSRFPLDVRFHFTTNQPALDVDGSLSAAIEASQDLQRFSISGLDSSFDIGGEPIGEETVEAGFSGDITANLAEKTASLSNFKAQLINLALRSELNVNGFSDSAQLSGSLAIEPFSARELLDSLGIPLETQAPDALESLALETDIGGPAGTIELSNFVLTLDDTQFKGGIQYSVGNGAIGVDLQGDQLNLDPYLPPPAATEAEEAPADETAEGDAAGTPSAPATAGAAPEADLLPLDTLRNLIFEVRLGLDELVVKNLQINAIEIQATGEDGLIRVDPIKGEMYDGDFLLTAQLDARQDTPQWQLNQTLNNVQTLPLLTDLLELELLSGQVNLRSDVETQGNRISALRENAQGSAAFTMDNGAFETINLTAFACEGIALANGETIDTQQWSQRTPFEDLSGAMQIDGNVLVNNDLSAALAGMTLDGEGTINLAEMLLDYELGLRVVGAIHKDNACRVNERIQNIVIPVECRGSLEDPGSLCSFDGSRFRDVLKEMAAAEAKRKVGEEIDEEVDKQLDDLLGEDAEGQDGTRKQIKDAIKGLFN